MNDAGIDPARPERSVMDGGATQAGRSDGAVSAPLTLGRAASAMPSERLDAP